MQTKDEVKAHCRFVGKGKAGFARCSCGLLLVVLSMSPMCICAHESAEMHYNDIACVLDGFGTPDYNEARESFNLVAENGFSPNAAASTMQSEKASAGFYEVVSQVSSKMDSMPRELEAKFGLPRMSLSHPKTHRFICHGWPLDGTPPEQVLKLFEMKTGLDRSVLLAEWNAYQKETFALVQKYTGLPLEKAKAFAEVIWDIHLLGDWTPDNSAVKWLLHIDDIMDDLRKNLETLLGERGARLYKKLVRFIQPMLEKGALDRDIAVQVLKFLKENRIGTAIFFENKDCLRGLWRSDVAVNVNKARATEKVQEKIAQIAAAKEAARAKAAHASEGKASAGGARSKELVDDVSKHCKKSRVVRVEGGSLENGKRVGSREALQSAGKDVERLKKMEGGLLKKNPKVTRVKTVIGVVKEVTTESGKKGVAVVVPASAIASATKAAAMEGCVAFVLSEGYAVCAYAYGGMSEDEFYRATVKNVTGSVVVGGATFAAVMLGAAPGGPVVMAIGIAGYVLVDIAFELARDPPFTLEDVLGITDDILADAYGFLDPKKDKSFLDDVDTPSFLNPPKDPSFLDPPRGKSFLDGF